ncbi:MAG TPA: hypothetical protein VER39_11860 [Nocardioidaceae bacterium]|nr:hypothetical protein [Nocardioidaceae bacterium]
MRWRIIRYPVHSRNAANRYSTQPKLAISTEPPAMNTPRKTNAPRTPKNSTRCWYSRGTAKKVKMIAQTKTLSTASDFSIR